ncbi:MAG: hypothetical protein HS111_27775 [Kofleriaceae bacterium]|nr:hypothetical protein [Kofleriaceae bacterium]MCL4228123.1 hypothetical protein [Myxococcales bacterium]
MRARAPTAVVAALGLGLGAGAAAAQSAEEDRFFVDKEDEDRDRTLWQGSLSSTSFVYTESGGQSTALVAGGATVPNASPFSRLFTELRAQVDGRHLRGGRWDLRADARGRLVNRDLINDALGLDRGDRNRIQSGQFGEHEYEVRELYLVRGGRRTDLFVGRQVIGDLAALKIDGLRVDYAKNARWTYLGFAGAYPLRASRSVLTDYPRGVDVVGTRTGRVVPVAGGFGAAYRTSRTYGAIGGVAIVPTRRDTRTDAWESPRVFVTTNGYARRSPRLDLYHYVVVDVAGAAGFALTNLTLGVQWKPAFRLRTNLSVNRVDTEVLEQQIANQLENVGPTIDGGVINNAEVQRIAADSVRGTVSAALGKTNRFEITTGLSARRRPEVRLEAGMTDKLLPATQAIELLVQAVDRRFYGGLRLDLSFIRGVGLGQASYARSTSQIVRLAATRPGLKGGKAELQGDLAVVQSADDNAGAVCQPGDVATCYGSANTAAVQGNVTGYYRFKQDWFGVVQGGVGLQKLTITDPATMGGVPQSSIVTSSLFLRVGYRF